MDAVFDALGNAFESVGEIADSPFGLVVLLAIIWRSLRGDGFGLIFASAVAAVLVVSVGIATLPSFFNLQAMSVEVVRQNLSPAQWDALKPEQYLMSERALLMAWTFLALVMLPQNQPWGRKVLSFLGFAVATTVLGFAFYFLFINYGLPQLKPTADWYADREQWMEEMARFTAYYMKAPVAGFAWGTSLYILLCIAFTSLSRALKAADDPVRVGILNTAMNILITIVTLSFALGGFFILPPYQATLFLIFWVVAYPPALAFARAKPLPSRDLVTIYKAGLEQVPFIGKLLSGLPWLAEKTSKPSRPRKKKKAPVADPSE